RLIHVKFKFDPREGNFQGWKYYHYHYHENKKQVICKRNKLMEQHQGVGLYTGFFKNLNLQVKIRGSYTRDRLIVEFSSVVPCQDDKMATYSIK
ncbi:hypothetical protein LDENG_00273780, partial [Lucifuga dentata]